MLKESDAPRDDKSYAADTKIGQRPTKTGTFHFSPRLVITLSHSYASRGGFANFDSRDHATFAARTYNREKCKPTPNGIDTFNALRRSYDFTEMATAVPSRFAVLSIDDDDCKPKKAQKSATASKTSQKSKNDKSKQQQQPKKDDKKKQNKKKKKNSNSNNESQQWEQWKQKDTMAVEETFEQELHQAILLSKLAYEEQLVSAARSNKEPESNKKSGKKSKKATMSLEEFNNLGSSPITITATTTIATSSTTVTTVQNSVSTPEHNDTKSKGDEKVDAEFFERIEKETKEEIAKGKEKDMLKARLNKLDDDITSAQLRVEVEKRDEIISQLRNQVDSLKEELTQVKERNKKLYQILSHGEMKDKASVLAEVAKLQEIRDELTSEVASLHAQLEQERSKPRTSTTDVKPSKQTNKKRPVSENA